MSMTGSSLSIFRDPFIAKLASINLFHIDRKTKTLTLNRVFVKLNNQFTYRQSSNRIHVNCESVWIALRVIDPLAQQDKPRYQARYNLMKKQIKKIELSATLEPQFVSSLWIHNSVRIWQKSLIFSDLVSEVIDDDLLKFSKAESLKPFKR